MKNLLITLFVFCSVSFPVFAENNPLWMRYPAISPDGNTIAFTYKGDIYTVPSEGGKAIQLTTHPAHDTRPVWSPDSKKIAFASNRNGNFDVYIVDKNGGVPKQLTSHSVNEYPETFYDNEHILYIASIQTDVKDAQFPINLFSQIYKVNIEGKRPELFSAITMQNLSINKKNGSILYHNIKGYEDEWRKHHQSSIARDIVLYTHGNKPEHKKITTFRGENRNPVWAPDGQSFYYLTEEKGSFNIFKRNLQDNQIKQITKHNTHPVRFLTTDNNGILCYGYDGEIYTVKEGSSPKKIDIRIISDQIENDVAHRTITSGASQIALAPEGKEIAFIAQGNVYVTSVEYETTKQITNTPEQERNIDFHPKGRSVVYSSERNGTWGIYQSSIVREEDKYFTYAQEIKEDPLVVTGITSFQPSYSPDGKEVAFLEDRTTLKVINLETKKVRTVLDGKYNYSYSDFDQQYAWSPDSKWFLVKYIDVGGWNNTDIALVKADGSGEVINLTESGYSDLNPRWVLDGKAMIWSSDRAGYRSHGSWGAHRDVYIMFFEAEAYDKFRLSKEELALLEEKEKDKDKNKKEDEKKDKEKKDNDSDKEKKDEENNKNGKDGKKDKENEEVKALVFDLENRKDRIIRLTRHSSSLADAVLTPKGDKLYYLAAFESGSDLWEQDFKGNTTKLLIKGVGGGQLIPDKKGENLFMVTGNIKKIEIKGNKSTNISFRGELEYRPSKEREYIFDHVWRLVDDKFYDPSIHGIDWKGYKKAYAKFLPHINNNYDFAEMLSEMAGELNGSHTGARYSGSSGSPATACLGVFYDNSYTGEGLKIAEIIAKGPLTKADTKIKAGIIIEKINGQTIAATDDYYPLLKGKAGKKVWLSLYNPETKERFEEEVKPITYNEQNNLLYNRWVESRRKEVDRLSDGRIGYVHVRSMGSASFRDVFSDLLGRYRNKEAVIVDTRFNGGGWLHDDLATLLSGKEYQRFEPRGQFVGSNPHNRWLKPSVVLVSESNYSDAHAFPWLYKELGIGKLVGTPIPGTMTAVWWEPQVDRTLVFGVPQVGVKDLNGNYLENQELYPDIEIYNSPEELLNGKDAQLEEGVKQLLKSL